MLRMPCFALEAWAYFIQQARQLSLDKCCLEFVDKLIYGSLPFQISLYFLIKCAFGSRLKNQLILLFSLFLLLYMCLTALFGTIYRSYCTISANFYLYLQYFQQKISSFSKISGFQIDSKCVFGSNLKRQLILLFKLFLPLLMAPLHFLVLFIGSTVLFRLIFTFIYSTFDKKFSVSAK